MPLRLPELLILFVVALLIFGPKKLPEMGAAIGRSLTAFRKGWQEISSEPSEDAEIMERRAELKRLELEALDREIAARQAALLSGIDEAPTATVNDTMDSTTETTYNTNSKELIETTYIPDAAIAYNSEPQELVETAIDSTFKAQTDSNADEQKQNKDRAEQAGSAS